MKVATPAGSHMSQAEIHHKYNKLSPTSNICVARWANYKTPSVSDLSSVCSIFPTSWQYCDRP